MNIHPHALMPRHMPEPWPKSGIQSYHIINTFIYHTREMTCDAEAEPETMSGGFTNQQS